MITIMDMVPALRACYMVSLQAEARMLERSRSLKSRSTATYTHGFGVLAERDLAIFVAACQI